jgi:lipoate-protein ligase A
VHEFVVAEAAKQLPQAGPRHDTSQFQSGNQALDRWLVRYAGQSERRDEARTFTDAGVVIGYYRRKWEVRRCRLARQRRSPVASRYAGS